MANRFTDPYIQYTNSAGVPLSGALLFFYITGTSTKTNTYTSNTLAVANPNPVVLGSDGSVGNVFLDPNVTYKVVLAPSTDSDPPTSPIWTADPVVDMAANVTAVFQVYNGDPNTHVAGNRGAVGGAGASVVWDTTDRLLWICVTTGNAANAVWVQYGAILTGSVSFASTITPSTITASQNDYDPGVGPDGSSAYSILRLQTDANWNITGLTGGSKGRLVFIENIGTSFRITLTNQDSASTTTNRFLAGNDVIIGPRQSAILLYDDITTRWRVVANPVAFKRMTMWVPASAMTSNTTNGPSAGAVEVATNLVMLVTKDFDSSTDEAVQFNARMPKGWDASTVTAQFVWKHAATTVNFGVSWDIDGEALSNGDAPITMAGAVSVDDTGGTTNDIYISDETAVLSIGGTPAVGDWVVFRVRRRTGLAGDTMAIDAGLLGLNLFYNVTTLDDT